MGNDVLKTCCMLKCIALHCAPLCLPALQAILCSWHAQLRAALEWCFHCLLENICMTGCLEDMCYCCRYHNMGGDVELLGKPGIAIYEAAMEMLGLTPEQLVAVGDSLQHDIAGALLASCLALPATLPNYHSASWQSVKVQCSTFSCGVRDSHLDLRAGACQAGIDSVLIGDGIHAAELAVPCDIMLPAAETLEALLKTYSCHATYFMPQLCS